MDDTKPTVRVVAGLLRRGDRVLLCHRHPERLNYPAVWDLPGGHIEEGETMAAALVRELAEELGIETQPPGPTSLATIEFGDVELNVFLVDRWSGEPRIAAPEEHDDLGWFGAEDLQGLSLALPEYVSLLTQALS